MKSNTFSGFENVKYWMGAIEDRVDPLGLGRCKVRVFGYHSDDTATLPTDDLPWMHSVFSMNKSKSYENICS